MSTPSSQKKGGVPCEKEQPTFLVQLLSPGQDRKETWHTEEGVYFFTCHFFSFRTLPQEILTLSLQWWQTRTWGSWFACKNHMLERRCLFESNWARTESIFFPHLNFAVIPKNWKCMLCFGFRGKISPRMFPVCGLHFRKLCSSLGVPCDITG